MVTNQFFASSLPLQYSRSRASKTQSLVIRPFLPKMAVVEGRNYGLEFECVHHKRYLNLPSIVWLSHPQAAEYRERPVQRCYCFPYWRSFGVSVSRFYLTQLAVCCQWKFDWSAATRAGDSLKDLALSKHVLSKKAGLSPTCRPTRDQNKNKTERFLSKCSIDFHIGILLASVTISGTPRRKHRTMNKTLYKVELVVWGSKLRVIAARKSFEKVHSGFESTHNLLSGQ